MNGIFRKQQQVPTGRVEYLHLPSSIRARHGSMYYLLGWYLFFYGYSIINCGIF